MTTRNLKCPKCKVDMEEGYILDGSTAIRVEPK